MMRFSFVRKFYSILFLTLVVMISATLLGATYAATADRIARQQHEQFMGYLEQMFPELERFTYDEGLYTVFANGQVAGYAFLAAGPGYSGEIRIMVAMENKDTIRDIIILSHTETPGIGTRMYEPAFIGQFAGLPVAELGNVDTLTGATVSTEAVIKAVTAAARERVAALG